MRNGCLDTRCYVNCLFSTRALPQISRERAEAGEIEFQSPGVVAMSGNFVQCAANLVRQARPIRPIDAPFEVAPRVRLRAGGLRGHPNGLSHRGVAAT